MSITQKKYEEQRTETYKRKVSFFQAEDGIRRFCLSRGLGDVYKSRWLGSVWATRRTSVCLHGLGDAVRGASDSRNRTDGKLQAAFTFQVARPFEYVISSTFDLVANDLDINDVCGRASRTSTKKLEARRSPITFLCLSQSDFMSR